MPARELQDLAVCTESAHAGCWVVPIADLFGALRLDAEAELILWHGVDGSSIATPISRILDDETTHVRLGGNDLTSGPDPSAPIVLRTREWHACESLELRALTALTFAAFVRGQR